MRDGTLKWPHRRVGVLNPNSRGHTKAWANFARHAQRMPGALTYSQSIPNGLRLRLKKNVKAKTTCLGIPSGVGTSLGKRICELLGPIGQASLGVAMCCYGKL